MVSLNIKKTQIPVRENQKKDLKCFGDNSGEIQLMVNGKDGPYKYSWSNGQSSAFINQLSAGNYYLSITDNQNCLIEKEVIITSPQDLVMELDKKDANCANPDRGRISIKTIQGGITPYSYFLDGKKVSFNGFTEAANVGNHEVVLRDSNGCELKYKVDIEEAFRGNINLQPDSISVILGDSVWLEVFTNDIDSIESINWTGPGNLSCNNCLRTSAFINSLEGHFKVTITDNNGCIYVESVYVKSKQGFYVPNVFSPNGDNINDYFNLITDRSIEIIDELHIYDRWGNQLYEGKNFPPNGIEGAWNGTVGDQKAMPGVYVYLFIFRDKTGAGHKLSGDLTLIR
jgi:gliding motility-associated-like protein